MRIKKFIILLLCCWSLHATAQDTLTVMSYNLLHFPDGISGCGTPINARFDTLRKIVHYAQPDILMICELQNEAGADSILTRALNQNGTSQYKRANFVPNLSGSDNLNNMFFYNSKKLALHKQDEIITNVRDVGEYFVYVKDPNLAVHFDTTYLDFYMTHLKAGNSSSDETARKKACNTIRQQIDNKPAERYHIFGGDFNFYKASEPGYQSLTTGGNYPFEDPIEREGNWHNNSNFKDVHTQSTRSSVNMDCGVTGGMDDRFDFLLVSKNVMATGNRVNYVNGSYQTLGNDGQHFNQAVNDGANNAVPDSVLSALYHLSDHLPVLMEIAIQLPGILQIDMSGKLKNQKTLLQWSINNANITSDSFTIEHSLDRVSFNVIGHKAVENQVSNYEFEHLNPVLGKNYYRITASDNEGVKRSPVIQVNNYQEKAIKITELYPNPDQHMTGVVYTPETVNVRIQLLDELGRVLKEQLQYLNKGRNTFPIQLTNLSRGIYFLRIQSAEQVIVKRIMKQ